MAYIKQDDAAAVRALMRSMCFSNGTIDGGSLRRPPPARSPPCAG